MFVATGDTNKSTNVGKRVGAMSRETTRPLGIVAVPMTVCEEAPSSCLKRSACFSCRGASVQSHESSFLIGC